MLRAAFGDDVVDHYVRAAEWSRKSMIAGSPTGGGTRFRAGVTKGGLEAATMPSHMGVNIDSGLGRCHLVLEQQEDDHDHDPMHFADRRIGLRRAPGDVAGSGDRGRGSCAQGAEGLGAPAARRPLQLVLKGVARLNEMSDEVVPELAHMMGRPVRYGGEYKGFNERSNYVAAIAADSLAPLVVEASDKFERRIEREPHGVVFVIAPWNYPYMTAINTIAPALMAGNTVVIKHATQTLLVGERMVRAFVEAGVPDDVFINLFLDHQTTSALIAAGNFNFINFTVRSKAGVRLSALRPVPLPVSASNSAARTRVTSWTTQTSMLPSIR